MLLSVRLFATQHAYNIRPYPSPCKDFFCIPLLPFCELFVSSKQSQILKVYDNQYIIHNRAPALGAGGRGFESRRPDIRKTADYQTFRFGNWRFRRFILLVYFTAFWPHFGRFWLILYRFCELFVSSL